MPKSPSDWDKTHNKRSESYARAIDALYNKAVDEFARLIATAKIDPGKPFSFKDYPGLYASVTRIINQLAVRMQGDITAGAKEEWLYACKKNDAFLEWILRTTELDPVHLKSMQDQNLGALKQFQNRKVAGMNLSDRVWKYTDQFKSSIELGIDVAVGEGNSAQKLSRELKQYLQNPEKLFRRVRDKRGQLQLSKAAKNYHPGQGVYRSSHQNAMRLARTEINMAYRTSEQKRWSKLDFVVGYEIRLSNNHTLNGKPFEDICDELAGRYPKWFVFKGWHPQCRCHAVPILMDPDEFNTDELNELRSALQGSAYKKYVSRNQVNDVPENFKKWIADNAVRSKNWSSQPYFIKDNFKDGMISGGLISPVPEKIKPVKTQAQKEDIQKRWNTRVTSRRYESELQIITEQWGDVTSIKNLISRIRSEINQGSSIQNVSTMMDKLNHKVQIKQAWDLRREENRLSTLLVDVKGLKSKFGIQAVQEVFNAVEAKLKSWEGLSLEQQQKKLKYEIGFVEEKQKYPTWKAAQDAYKKRLAKVEYLIEKEAVQESISAALVFKTKSAKVKQLTSEIQALLEKDAPISILKAKAQELNDKVSKLDATKQNKKTKLNIDEGEYSQQRKDQALWAKSGTVADKQVRSVCEKVWQKASPEEKTAAHRYTNGSSYINEPLRRINYSGPKSYDGLKDAEHLANMIDRSSYDFDIWVQRGVGIDSVYGIFKENLAYMNIDQARNSLLGKIGSEPAFSSCGVSKGTGFSDKPVIYNIYCPRGTKMLYAEPFSAYGNGHGASWDGRMKQTHISYEAEMILQRGTKFRVIKIEKSGSRWYIDLEVIG